MTRVGPGLSRERLSGYLGTSVVVSERRGQNDCWTYSEERDQTERSRPVFRLHSETDDSLKPAGIGKHGLRRARSLTSYEAEREGARVRGRQRAT